MSNLSYEQDIFLGEDNNQDKCTQTESNRETITNQYISFFNKIKSCNYKYYHSKLETIFKADRYLLDILDVFKHISLGAKISDEYFDDLNNYICKSVYGVNIEELDTLFKMNEIKKSFNGRIFTRVTIKYVWEDYPVIAKCCIDWMSSNPEKISIN